MEEMSPWASRRKTLILIGVVLVLFGISFGIFWKFWYKAPTCFDGIQNGDERGIDCGGSCAVVCSSGVMAPIVRWDPRVFQVNQGLWSVLVYVENPNVDVDGSYVPYTFTIYDKDNQVLETRTGATILPKNKTVGIFEGEILAKDGKEPKRAVFELGKNIVWKKNENASDNLSISNGSIQNGGSSPRVSAMVKNNGLEEIKNIEMVIAIFDGGDNAIAASRTFIDSLKKNQSSDVLFTWPKPFELGTKVCEKPSDIMLLLDKSGSMSSVSQNPPQPLTDAKSAAASFIDQLGPKDKIGLVSFATQAKNPIDLTLSSDFNLGKQAVQGVSIEGSGTQYTNIYDALHSAWQELVSARGADGSSKIMVLLTDGVANNPKDPNGRTEADDVKYAESAALKETADAKSDNLIIYTIGLGKDINSGFLKKVASSENNYYFAPNAADLEGIYKNISSDICKELPARIEITYKIFGSSI